MKKEDKIRDIAETIVGLGVIIVAIAIIIGAFCIHWVTGLAVTGLMFMFFGYAVCKGSKSKDDDDFWEGE